MASDNENTPIINTPPQEPIAPEKTATPPARESAADRTDDTAKDFSEFNLDPRLVENLDRCGYKKPTLIQHKAIPEILEGKSCLVSLC